jgi:hypothetical protein
MWDHLVICKTGAIGSNQVRHQRIQATEQEHSNMSIDKENKECEWLLAVGHMDTIELDTINESLNDLGLSLNDPDVWIEDTGATTHNTAYIKNAVNHRTATSWDNIVGVTGPPAEAKLIVDIPCETNCDRKNSKFVLKVWHLFLRVGITCSV